MTGILIAKKLFPPASAVEGIKSVPSVCVCVCLSVCERSHGWTIWHADPKFGGGVDLDNISDEFKDQGHRSKVKVARLKNVISEVSDWWITQSQFVMTPDVMTSRHDVLTPFDDFWARILTKRAHRGRARQRSGVFILAQNWEAQIWFKITWDVNGSP